MQAITVKYLGPNNRRGSALRAECAAGSKTIPYAQNLNHDEAFRQAAEALIHKLGWDKPYYGKWHQGTLKDGRDVFVCDSF
jgi:hypothetical protein